MKYYIFTLGCQMNVSDSQRIATKLEEIGYTASPERDADLVIVNACSVRQSAIDRIWGKIRNWQRDKKDVYVTGCVLPSDKQKFADRNIKFFDINKLPKLFKDSDLDEYFNIKPKLSGDIAYIPIMTGCDNFCAYCAVPITRGREILPPEKDVIVEVEEALKKGFKKILLLGQNVNSYKQDGGDSHSERSDESLACLAESRRANARSHIRERSFTHVQDDKAINNDDFIKLLKAIDELPYEFGFNFMSSNPHDMGDELIKTFAHLKKWPKELHLAMQSGDDEILRKMNRKYNSEQYFKLIENLKLKIENLILTTDIIVGYPGETKAQFNNTVRICKKIGFSKAYISQYSPRPGTASAKLVDDIPKAEKKRRWLVLDNLINK